MRIGTGYDIHRLVPTVEASSIALGGIPIPCFYEISAHSDGDVLLHAIVDACLGALALGDIGQWFPDNASENRGRSSREFVQKVHEETTRLGWEVLNVDTTVLLEVPKLAPHAEKIRRSIAELLQVELSSVSVKAKTMEQLGPIGERKAIAAQASVLLGRKK